MVAQRAGDDEDVARLGPVRAQLHSGGDGAEAAGVDEHSVGLAVAHDLGVAAGDLHPRLRRGLRDALHNALQLGEAEALLNDDAQREEARDGAEAGEVVHRAVDRELADVPAREKERRHSERVGGEGYAPAGLQPQRRRGEVRGVIQRVQHHIAQPPAEHLHQLAGLGAAAAVRQPNRLGHARHCSRGRGRSSLALHILRAGDVDDFTILEFVENADAVRDAIGL